MMMDQGLPGIPGPGVGRWSRVGRCGKMDFGSGTWVFWRPWAVETKWVQSHPSRPGVDFIRPTKSRLCPVPQSTKMCVKKKHLPPNMTDSDSDRERDKRQGMEAKKSKQNKTVQQRAWLAPPN